MSLVQELNIFPVKSCQGMSLQRMDITLAGPAGDRQWMLVDDKGQFLSQRTLPKLATVEVHFDGKALSLGLGKQFFVVPAVKSPSREVEVKIWNDTVVAALEPDLYSQALSQYLGVSCRLVRYTAHSHRRLPSVRQDWQPEVRFSDRQPLLLINLKSLEDLNGRLLPGPPVGPDRFRPNLVYQGQEPFEEEAWRRIQVGGVVFSQPRKCSRCKIITLDQKTGQSQGAEPLKTLGDYRRDGAKINFGVLWTPENEGRIQLGDELVLLES